MIIRLIEGWMSFTKCTAFVFAITCSAVRPERQENTDVLSVMNHSCFSLELRTPTGLRNPSPSG
jgi:hypothetical protein